MVLRRDTYRRDSNPVYYTLVRHTGFSVAGNRQFERAVELYSLPNESRIQRVKMIGGMVFNDYMKASDAEEAINYPPGHPGVCPEVQGRFARYNIEGNRVYIPTPEEINRVKGQAMEFSSRESSKRNFKPR